MSGTPSTVQIFAPPTFQATEQTALDLKGKVVVADADAGDSVITVVLSVSYGVIAVSAGTSGATVTGGNGTGTVTITGTLNEISALLDTDPTSSVTYTADTDAPPASATLTVTADDGDAGGADPDGESVAQVTIDINAVNDAPTVAIGVPRGGYKAVGDEVMLNTTVQGFQGHPAVAALADGGYVATWWADNAGGSFGILSQRYDSSGIAQGGEVRVNTTPNSSHGQPKLAIAALDGGGYVVTWAGSGPGGTYGVFAQRLDASGVPQGGEVPVRTTGGIGFDNPSIAALSDGGYVVTYEDWTGSGVFAQRYDALGVAQGSEVQVSTSARYQSNAAVAGLGDGGYIVTWHGSGSDGRYEIFARRYDASGVAQGGAVQVNTTTANYGAYPSVSALVGGGYVVTWHGPNGGDLDVFAQRFDASGVAQGGEVRVNTTAAGHQSNPEVAALSDGGYVVTWFGNGPDDTYGVFARSYDSSGRPIGGDVRINSTIEGDQYYPKIAGTADGGFVVTWVTYSNWNIWDVYGRRYERLPDGFIAVVGRPALDLKGQITVADADAGDATLSLLLSADSGVLDVAVGTSGATIVSGNGTSAVTVAGTIAQLNALLNTDITSSVTYTPENDTPPESAMLTVVVNDRGNSGSDPGLSGDSSSEEGRAQIGITIGTLSEAPEGADGTIVLAEDGTHVFAAADFGFSDADGDALEGVIITTLPTKGVLALDGVAVQAGDIVSAVDIASGLFVFTPRANANGAGYASFTFQVVDDGGLYNDVNTDETPNTIAFDVTAVNDAPTITITPSAGETRVNTTTESTQMNPSAAPLTGGGYVVTWMSYHESGSGRGIYVQRYDASGTAQGGEVRVDTTAEFHLSASVAALDDGGYVVVWAGFVAGTVNVYAQRYDSSGIAQGGELLVSTGGWIEQAAVAGLAGGGFVVTWEADGDHVDIHARRYDASGIPQGSAVTVNTHTTFEQESTAIAALSDGGYVVAWMSKHQDGSEWGIFAQRYDASGTAQGGEVRVNTVTASNQMYPTVAALTDGGYVIAWMSLDQDGSSWGVYSQRHDASGAAQGGETLVNTTTESYQAEPSVTGLSDGGYVVSWISYDQDGSRWGVYAQRYDASGATRGGEIRVNSFTAGDQNNPAIVGLSGGDFVVVWQSMSQDGDSYGVYAQHYGSFVATERTPLNLKDSITIADVDSGGSPLTLTLSVDYGVLNVAVGTSGATVVSGNGTGTVVISGTLAQLDALLDGDATSIVTFTADTDLPPLSATLNVTVDDGGATGADPGTGGAGQQSSAQVTIAILAVDGAPEVHAALHHLGLEDADFVFSTAAGNPITVSDADSSALTVTLSVTRGTLRLSQLDGVTVAGNGSGTIQLAGTADAINAALEGLAYRGGLNDEGDVPLTITVGDGNSETIETITITLADDGKTDGTVDDDLLTGTDGDDLIFGYDGDDVIDGGEGADEMHGGAGDDTYTVDDRGDLVIELPGDGIDTVRTSLGMRVAPPATPSLEDLYVMPANVENLIGTAAGDQAVCDNALDNVIMMGSGNDLVVAVEGGADRVDGGEGNDFLFFGSSFGAGDIADGGAGTDTLAFLGGGGATFGVGQLVSIERLAVYSGGGLETDPFSYVLEMNDDNVAAGKELLVAAGSLQATETLTFDGSGESDGRFIVIGGAGNDTITGGGGQDHLAGGDGDDVLDGGDGNDVLVGGRGADVLIGGSGREWFRYESVNHSNEAHGIDRIVDFGGASNGERIDLSAIDADVNRAGDQAFTFIGVNASFTSRAGELRVINDSDKWFVQGDVDGDGVADLIIQVMNGAEIPWAGNDFIS